MVLSSFGRILRKAGKDAIRALIPLSMRKQLAIWVHRQEWIGPDRRAWWSVELIRDLADANVDSFHEFLWANHLGYASSYEAAIRFGADNVKASRKMFLSDLLRQIGENNALGKEGIRSIFEVGCSLGYQLRYMETDVFPSATSLAGIDIDRYAIQAGSRHLRSVGSRIALQCGDTRELERWLGGRTYDLIVCTGVLMYLNEAAAAEAIETMLRNCRLLALSGLAHPMIDNAELKSSDVRASDRTFIHNFEHMVARGGGRVVWSRWEGDRDVDGNTIYFVFATGV